MCDSLKPQDAIIKHTHRLDLSLTTDSQSGHPPSVGENPLRQPEAHSTVAWTGVEVELVLIYFFYVFFVVVVAFLSSGPSVKMREHLNLVSARGETRTENRKQRGAGIIATAERHCGDKFIATFGLPNTGHPTSFIDCKYIVNIHIVKINFIEETHFLMNCLFSPNCYNDKI